MLRARRTSGGHARGSLAGFPATARLRIAAPMAALLAAPFVLLLYQALLDPKIEFLPPSLRGGWALHPVQEILHFQHGRVSKDVVFAREFVVSGRPRAVRLRARAFTAMRVRLNGEEVPVLRRGANWKRASTFELRPRLGRNRLEVHVSNAGAVPALLVEAPDYLRTRASWAAALEPDFREFRPVVSPTERGPKPGPLQQWSGWRWARWAAVVWLAGSVAVPLAAVVRRRSLPPRRQRAWPRAAGAVVPALIVAASAALNLWNTSRYPYSRASFDWAGHVEYIQRMADTWRAPLANEGWEFFQPPLYYYPAAAIYRLSGGLANKEQALKRVQYLGCVSGIALVLLTWAYARLTMPESPSAHCVAVAFAGFLPMSLYMNPLISNEVFSAAVIAAALYLHVRWAGGERLSSTRTVALGLVAALALLAKYTALFTFVAGAIVLARRAMRRKRAQEWRPLGVYVAVVLALCGWYYARNARVFGDPFIGNWDYASGFHYEQNPSYRSASSYLTGGAVFFHSPERARWTGWFDGNYASMWADGHTNFLREENRAAFLGMGVAMVLAAFPSALIVLGLGKTVRSALRGEDADILLAVVPIYTWAALISFTMEIPTYSTLKAFFFLSLVPALGVFLARGRAVLSARFRWARWALDVTVLALAAGGAWIYRFPG